ncbi:MAG: heme ABC transporter ATP-binding protein [Halanaeroarchaeum sp.]
MTVADDATDLLARLTARVGPGTGPSTGPGSADADEDRPPVVVDGVSVDLGSVPVLEDVSMTVGEGEFVGLIGPNGAGKTTLLRTISAVLRPTSGRVLVDGVDVQRISSRAVSRRVAVVPQDTHLAFDFSVRDVVAMGRTPYRSRVSFGERPDRSVVEDAMARATVADLADRSIDEVSGGERQRVLLARALAQETPVLLLDEPTANLDIHHQIRTLEIVRSLVDEGRTVVSAIHDLNLAAHYCDELVLLGDGRILAQGSPADVLTEEHLETAFGTQAVVTSHPVTGSVYVMALPAGATEATRERVHVVGGGGTSARLLYLLAAAGFDVSVGALHEGDSDLETARLLGIDALTLDPGATMTDADVERVREAVETAAVTVLADVEVGIGNLGNLRAAAAADDLVIVEERPFSARNFAGEAAAERYEALRSRASVVAEDDLIATVESLVDDDLQA